MSAGRPVFRLRSLFVCAALALFLTSATPARADPISIAVLGVFGIQATATAVAVTTFILTTAASLGVGLLQKALQKKPEFRDPGVQLEVEVGDDSAVGFVAGTGATAGTRKYVGSWGSAGKTPNAYFTDVIQVGDLPAPGQPGIWVNGKKCTVLWGEAPAEQGYPVEEFRVGGTDYLWVRYRDGTATTADAFLMAKFGADPDRPFEEDMIGRGCPAAIFTARLNRDLFPGQMQWLIEPPVLAWYDIRKDDTAGGSGDHRWDDQSTWEPSDNNAVVAYNIIRGVYYDDGAGYREWLFGGQGPEKQGLPAFRLPAASWMAAANACDALIDLDGGGSEKQFRCGYEVRGDMEPLAVVEELLKAASGRIAEVGGIFKIILGAPGSAVYAFTDAEIIITKGQSFKPFPTLDETHNGIEATYPEPLEMWSTKDAPAIYSGDLVEAEDGDRRLITGVNFAAAPFPVQVQRLMKAMLEEHRRFTVHSFWLPPEAWLLEPAIDVVSWTSARNGYVNKKFLIARIVGERTKNQLVVLVEIGPADHDWTPATDEQPTSTGFLGPIRPPAQAMTGWQVFPATIASGNYERPSIEVRYAGDLDDVQFVHVQARLTDTLAVVFDGSHSYGEPGPDASVKSNTLSGQFLPDTAHQVRGRFLPFSGRETEWSDWLAVTTPDTRLSEDELSDDLAARVNAIEAQVRELTIVRKQLATLDGAVASIEKSVGERIGRLNIGVGAKAGSALALAETVQVAQANADKAFAAIFQNVVAENPQGSAEAFMQILAEVDQQTQIAAIKFMVRAGLGQALAEAGFRIEAGNSPGGLLGRVVVAAGQFFIESEGGGLLYEDGVLTSPDGRLSIDLANGSLTIDDGE